VFLLARPKFYLRALDIPIANLWRAGQLGSGPRRCQKRAPAFHQDIAAPASKVRVLVVQAQVDWAIARECWKLQSRPTAASPN
jgi:hypothetical protein